MNILIASNLKTLEQLSLILSELDDSSLANQTIKPYGSSIGSHIRHILDFYNCILSFDEGIDFTTRERDPNVETSCLAAKLYLETIVSKLKNFSYEKNANVVVKDDLGLGTVSMVYTYDAVFAQANSHTIHHYAIINYIMNGLRLSLKASRFGYNPTTEIK